jgi:hypothetical protein
MYSSDSSSPPPGVERRQAPRTATELSVLVGDGAVVSWARCVEISTGGVLLSRDSSTDNDWRIYLRLELELPGRQEPINAVARPVWSRGPFQALKFVRMSAADRLAVAEHVDRCSRAAAAP